MTTILIVRHGYSESNVTKTFTGHIDAPLSDVGIKQAQLTCDYIFNNYNVDAVYSSDLSRAVNTVKPLAEKLNTKVITDVHLRELYGGKWEGLPFSELPKLFPEDFKMWQENVGLARCTDGESYAECQARIVDVLLQIAEKEKGKTLVVATHGGIIRALECYVRKIPLERMSEIPYVQNASVSVINCKGKSMSFSQSDYTAHLGGLLTAMPKGI